MIAFADCAPTNWGDAFSIWLTWDGLCIAPDGDQFALPPPVFRHNQGANAVFCDAHVEFGKQPAWVGKTDDVRSRWNNDNQPHRETWR
jgi:prepilin-type processing-associated H-X9-DG protein